MMVVTRRLMLGTLLAGMAASLSACVGKLPLTGVKQLQDVEKSYSDGEYRDTVLRANEFLAKYPDVEVAGEAHYLRGLAYVQLKDRSRAKQDFEQALQSAHRSDLTPLVQVSLGNLEFESGNLAAAAERYRQVVEKLPNDSPKDMVLFRLGQAYARQGSWSSCKPWFTQLILLFPGSLVEPLARRYVAANGFCVQTGVFRDFANAQRQVEFLNSQKLSARRSLDPATRLHIVQVGSYRTYGEARTAQAQVCRIVPEAIIVP